MSYSLGEIVATLRQLQAELPADATINDWERALTERLPRATDRELLTAVNLLKVEDRTVSDPSWRRYAN